MPTPSAEPPAETARPIPAGPGGLGLGRVDLGVMLVILVVHLLALQLYSGTPAARHPMVDAFVYWDQADRLLRGQDPFAEGYYQPPAYPMLLAELGRLTGGLSLTLTRVVQVLLSVLSAGGLLLLGRRIGAGLGLRWVGPVAALLFGLYPTTLLFSLDILTPALTGALLIGALLCLYLPAAPLGLRRALGAGLLLGLCVALHPTFLLAGIGVLVMILIGWLGGDGGRRAAMAAAFGLGLSAPVAPTALHNWRQFGVVELVSHNAGLNLYLGNNPGMEQTAFLRAGLPFRKLVLDADPDDRNLAERNAYWKGRLASEVFADPLGALRVLAVKLWWSLHDTEIPRNEDLRCRTRSGEALAWLRFSPVRYGAALSFAWLGGLYLWRRRGEAEGALAAGWARQLGSLWLCLHLPVVLFLVADRYRVASWPLLSLLGGVGVAVMVERWPWRSGEALDAARRLFAEGRSGLASVAGVLMLQLVPIHPPTEPSDPWCRYTKANLAFEEGELDEARTLYLEVLGAWPDDMGANSWLAYIAARREDWPTAIRHMREVTKQFPEHFPSWRELADWQLKADDREGAVRSLQSAYRVPGDRTSTGVKLVKLLRALGREEEANLIIAGDAKLAAHPKLNATGE